VLFLFLFPVSEIQKDFSSVVLSPPWIGLAGIAFAGVVLMVFGFAAVYSRLYQDAGSLGLVGFVFIEIAYLLQACKVTWEIFIYPNHSGELVLYGAAAGRDSARSFPFSRFQGRGQHLDSPGDNSLLPDAGSLQAVFQGGRDPHLRWSIRLRPGSRAFDDGCDRGNHRIRAGVSAPGAGADSEPTRRRRCHGWQVIYG
jgi:hypothetical protein